MSREAWVRDDVTGEYIDGPYWVVDTVLLLENRIDTDRRQYDVAEMADVFKLIAEINPKWVFGISIQAVYQPKRDTMEELELRQQTETPEPAAVMEEAEEAASVVLTRPGLRVVPVLEGADNA